MSQDPHHRSHQPSGSDDVVSTVIPYKNGLALASYYCGVFSLIPCLGAVLGPVAIVLGILGLRKVNQDPRVKGTGHAITGLVLGGLATLGNCVGAPLFIFLSNMSRA